MTVYYDCPCGHEIEVKVIRQEDTLPENCPECGKPLPEDAHEKVLRLADEKAADAEDWR